MPTVYDSRGNRYELSQQIGRGGEGTVFLCPGDLSLVAKIYHEPVSEEKADKLRWMAGNKNERLLKVAAWIVDTLHESPAGPIVGFLMPNVRAKEIHELYSLKSRRIHFPEATWQFLIHAAANVARAFYGLHRDDHVMGDVNHGNCVVLADGTVKLIDCDSYSIKADDIRYSCDVGVGTHLAPELQGRDLSSAVREKKHDNFGLAVIIFQLLFLGRHPFAGNYLGAEDKSLEDCIRERRFAYGNNSDITKVRQPPGTLPLEAVSPRIALMFERAFLTEDRPEPREWIEALEDLAAGLVQCEAHIGHFYFEALDACPWCSIESQTGLILFPFVGVSKRSSDQDFNIVTVEKLIESLDLPRSLPVKPSPRALLRIPTEHAAEVGRQNHDRFIKVGLAHFAIVFFATAFIGFGTGFVVGLMFLITMLVITQSLDSTGGDLIREELEKARRESKTLDEDWSRLLGPERFEEDLESVRAKIDEHHEIQQQSRARLTRVSEEVLKYRLDRFLLGLRIADAEIQGLGAEGRRALDREQIYTAADIGEWRLRLIPEIDPATASALVAWRREGERSFDGDGGLTDEDRERVESEFADRRRKVEREIEQLLGALRSGAVTFRQQQKMLAARAEAVAERIAQSEADLKTVGTNTRLVVVLAAVTVVVPMIGTLFSSPRVINDARPAFRNANKAPSSHRDDFIPAYQVSPDLTQKQIDGLGSDTRERSARALALEAEALIAQNDYFGAESKLAYAEKFAPEQDDVLRLRAELLFRTGRFNDARIANERRVFLADNRESILVLRAKTSSKLGLHWAAIEALQPIADSNTDSFEVNFWLGRAYRLNGENANGLDYLKLALAAGNQEPEVYYELALCHKALGNDEDARAMYDALYYLDRPRAEKLRKELERR